MRLHTQGILFGIASLLLAAGSRPASSQQLFFDNFNAEPGFALNYTGFLNWNVTRGTVDVYQPYAGLGFGVSVDMDGSSSAAGRLETKTTFSLNPGSYILEWDMGKNGDNLESMNVTLGGAYTEIFSDGNGYPTPVHILRNINVGLGGDSGVIAFDHAGGDNGGYVIDNVTLTAVTPTADTPEPGTLALVGALSLVGVRFLKRRRK